MDQGLSPEDRRLLEQIHQRVAGTSRAGWHVRRNLPFYAVALIAAAIMVVAPTRQPGTGMSSFGGASPAGSPYDDAGFAGAEGPAAVAGSPGAGPAGAGNGAGRAGRARTAPGGATAPGGSGSRGEAGTPAGAAGATRGGFACGPGVRQLPWSSYAAPCVPAWQGDNGGATYPGVTGETIKVVIRSYADNADAQAQRVILERSGAQAEPGAWQKRFDAYVAYFNEAFETYGRRVEFELFTSAANQFDEVNGNGRELACADATRIKEELGAFMTLSGTGNMYGPYAECAAERGMVLPIGPYGFPEEWYDEYHPTSWAVQMSCNRSTELFAEYVTKRLDGDRAIWALDPLYQRQERVFGAIGPDIHYYKPCQDLYERRMKEAGIEIKSRYSYVLDPARLQAQATQAVIQFKADGVTTLLAAADFLTMISLTEAADQQDWGPEWILQGSGFQDDNRYATLYNQERVDGHMFGQSIQGDTEVRYGPGGESAETYRRITGEEAPEGTDGWYFDLVHIFNMIQAAGPNLTPDAIAAGMARLPDAGPPSLDLGYWSFRHATSGEPGVLDHSAVEDVREVFWDGSQSRFVPTYGGRRFRVGEWPDEKPPVYPDH